MEEIIYTVPGNPVAWARARYAPGSRKFYDCQKDEKCAVGYELLKQYDRKGPYDGPLSISFQFYMRIPTRLKNRSVWHCNRPDIDNLIKFYLDVCKDIGFFTDDAQVSQLSAFKQYARNPHVSFIIRELNDEKV
jgi:Holliday junction resolvase RusA-like endonuclease